MNFERLGTAADDITDGTSSDFTDVGDDGLEPGLAEEFGIRGSGKSGRRIGDGTVAIIGALLVAGAALVGMRWMGSQHATLVRDTTVEARVTAFLEQFVNAQTPGQPTMKPDKEGAVSLVSLLDDDRTLVQVPLDEVKKNPFILIEEASPQPVEVETEPEEDEFARRRREATRRYMHLEDFAADIEISSIMGNVDNRVAIIEGQVVQVGDLIEFETGELFNIVRINSFDVILESEGFEFIVEMQRR